MFLDLLVKDVQEARYIYRFLRKSSNSLSEVEKARRDRLIGRYYEVRSKHAQALAWTEKARRAFRSLGHREGEYQCMLTMFGAYLHSGRYDDARSCAMETIAVAAHDQEKMKVHANLGNLEHRLHRYHQALNHFRAALRLLDEDPRVEAIILYNLANVLVCLNRFSEAETNYKRALELFRSEKITIYQAHVLQASAHLHLVLGQYFIAETQLRQARDLYHQRGDKVGAALCDLDLFHQNIRLNKLEKALAYVDELIEEFTELALPYEVGLIYYYAATAAITKGDDALAELFLGEATEYFENVENKHYQALCAMRRGNLLWKAGDKTAARELIQDARTVFFRKNLKELELECLTYLCLIDDRVITDSEYRRMRRLLAAPIGPAIRIQGLLLVSDYWHARGQLKRAIESRFEAVMTIEESRASIISEDLRESFFMDKARAYETLIEWLFSWKNPKASNHIFKVLGLSRGRQYAERLSRLERLPPVLNKQEPTLLALNKLNIRLDQLDRRLRDFSSHFGYAEEEKAALLEAQRETFDELNRLKLKMRDEERLGIYFPIDISPDEIRKYLPKSCLVVSYFIGNDHIYRVELDKKGLHTFETVIPKGFRKNINLLVNMLANRIFGRMDQIQTLMDDFEKVILPKRINQNRHIVFIPHKFLTTFPFALLSHNGRRLLETHTINICPNLPTLYFTLKKPRSSLEKPVFFFSDHPDDPTAPERDFLERLFPHARVFNRLEGAFQSELSWESDFIHFAGHGSFNRREPSKSYLQMAGEKLYLSELGTKHLGHPFINLASCQSGSMALTEGNELYGFVASFFAMGATTILAGLWDLDDEATGQWMVSFYKNAHLGSSEAFRRACLELMEQRPEPYFWAGFCLLGKP